MAATETSPQTIQTNGSTETSGFDQKAEVASVKASFPNRCRTIADVGEYSHVVTVQPENLDATIKFQLPASYPGTTPQILIRSESLTKENTAAVTTRLLSKAQELEGRAMLHTLIAEAEMEFRALGLKPGKSTNTNKETFLDQKSRKEKKKRRKPKSEDEVDQNQKLPPMKTADDVVKRIIWDEHLNKDDFLVGYFDRFRGLVEKYFSAFSWEDLASVDYDVLAVPKHRIQYFKYKDVKVWDKPRRVDNVFGSAEGTKTIDVVIREVEERDRLENPGQSVETASAVVANGVVAEDSFTDDSEEESSDDDDDDGIVVTLGASGSIGTGVPLSESKQGMSDKPDEENDFDPYWRDKLRPNYFLCVRITAPSILEAIGNIQDHLIEKEPRYAECLIPGASLHITLNTLGLDTSEQLQQCIDVLERIKPDLEAWLPETPVHLQGVSHFYNRVIYAQVQHNKKFLDFCNHLKLLLREAGVQIRDGYEFVPHVTIMKVTRPVSRLMGTKNIDKKLYQKFKDTEFGNQAVSSIYLCSMGNDRRSDGFYLSPAEHHFEK